MADGTTVTRTAAEWWACTALLGPDPDAADDALAAHLLTRIWLAIDPLARQPLAEAHFSLRAGFGSPAAWAFVMAPHPLWDVTGLLALEVRHATTRQFADASRRAAALGRDLDVPDGANLSVMTDALAAFGTAVWDYETATSLFEAIERLFAADRQPTWFAFPDDLCIVEFRHGEVSSFLMARRGDDWYVLGTPASFDELGGRRSGGDPAGVREPRRPIGPTPHDHATADHPVV